MIELTDLTPAAGEGWALLFELAEEDHRSWVLIGGQMMHLLAVELNAAFIRPTDDVDVVVNVRTRRSGTQRLSFLKPLGDEAHPAWRPFDAAAPRAGRAALELLLRG